MKNKVTTLLFLAMAMVAYSQTPCINGKAGVYPCKDYDLMSNISLNAMGATGGGNDSWGWTDAQNGKEYAIMGLNNGTAFIDISNAANPVFLGRLPTATSNSQWRDIKVYKNHAFIVSEAANHGMQVFDLTRLRNVSNAPQNFTADARYTQFGNAHNIVINEDSGYAYVVGAQRRSGTYKGGPLFINIQNPKNPTNAGGYLSGGQRAYTHDAQVITYNGPDSDYTGKEILIGSNEIEVVIADITNKSNPKTISTIKYADIGYTHQGWFTQDSRYFILGDETDEQGVGFNTRTIVFDFQDLDNPKQHMTYTGPTPAIDHNGYVKGSTFFLANYRAGFRAIDIAGIGNKNMKEVGFFDTYTNSNGAAFNGVWNVYPYFPSGNIILSDIEKGLFVIRKSSSVSCQAVVPSRVTANNIGGTTATISWNPVAGATYDVSYQIGNGPATTNTVSGTSTTLSGLTPNTTYRVRVRSKCSGGTPSAYSSPISFTTTVVQLVYCDANGNNANDEYMSNVTIGGINNNTTNSAGGYGDFTALSTNLAKGSNQTISITPTWSGTVYNEAYSVWIDYNQDGDFSDSGEQVWTQAPARTTPVNGSFSVPASAVTGTTRMRVTMRYNVLPSPCNSFNFGEVEDYTVVITGGGSGTPGGGSNGCTSGITTFPYSEGFENSLGAWTQSTADDINWARDANGTPSANTGPSNAAQGSSYVYVEASVLNTGYPTKRAILNSPCFDLSQLSSATFSFSYHMFGAADMGSIALEASTDNGSNWTSIWNQTGNKGNSWNTANVNLSAYTNGTVQLRFNRVTGATWQADIAIDNIALTSGASKIDDTNNQKLSLIIAPNPLQGSRLNVSLNIPAKEAYEYEIRNYIGQLVGKGMVTDFIDAADLKTGVYFLSVTVNGQNLIKRFVKR